MTEMKRHDWAAIVAAAWLCAACGCAASNDRHSERGSSAASASHDAWGATFSLPSGFSGGQNDAGGIELTDGDVAVMIGRHAHDGVAFETFAEERRRALSDLGAAESLTRSAQRVSGRDAVVLSGPGAEGVELRLLLVPLDDKTGLSFLFVAEGGKTARLDAAWSTLLGSLSLPK
ncbi:MAG: hypothetical protein IT377_12015 [Polyangiaceae bacterium]|nr:hypothetical protein [Polyangiaceae bacterium]